MKKINGKWLILALLLCLLIAVATRQPMFTAHSTEQMLQNPFIDSSFLNVIVRKLVHMTVFGTLAIFFLLSFWQFPFRYSIGWFFATLYGAIDEWHQSFIPNRAGVFTDVLIDSAGALIAVFCFSLYQAKFRKKVANR